MKNKQSDLVQAASTMVAVTHFSGCIDGSTVEARDYLERALGRFRKTGAASIAAERERQIEMEGWKPETDAKYESGELIEAAEAYAVAARLQVFGCTPTSYAEPPAGWPWHVSWWKPATDPIRNLEKSGALLAAEIDRLKRARGEAV